MSFFRVLYRLRDCLMEEFVFLELCIFFVLNPNLLSFFFLVFGRSELFRLRRLFYFLLLKGKNNGGNFPQIFYFLLGEKTMVKNFEVFVDRNFLKKF